MKQNHALDASLVAALLLALLWCVPGANADGNPPNRMTYQGYVVDGNGNPLGANALGQSAPKNYDVIFRIYNDQSGGTRLWSEQQTITVDKGYFSVLLGEGSMYSGESRPDIHALFSSPDASDRYVELTVRGIGADRSDSTILPRLRLLTSPYSFLARNAVFANSLVNDGNGQVVTIIDQNVGINKANPAVPLDVNGVVAATGLTVNGSATATSLTVNNNATVGGALNVAGATTTAGLTVNGPVNVSGGNKTVTAGTFVGNGTIPVGGIIMWSGATVPVGWHLCDGGTYFGQRTPNLQGRFILASNPSANPSAGLSQRLVDQWGGEETHKLVPAEMPSHTHSITFADNGYPDGGGDRTPDNYIMEAWRGNQQAFGSSSAGGDGAHNTMPPFYVLAFIMRVQ